MFNTCEKCGVIFERDRKQVCCSISCANQGRVRSKESRSKVSKTLADKFVRGELLVPKGLGGRKRKEVAQKGPRGGLRFGAGRGKSGYYQGVPVSSTWECAYLIYHLENHIPIQRCEEVLPYNVDGVCKLFHPDFVVGGHIVELKGPQDPNAEFKKAAWGNLVQFLYREDLRGVFKWVEDHTGLRVANLDSLYDEPRKNWPSCKHCGSPVKERRRVFCGNSCKMLHKRGDSLLPVGDEHPD